MWHPGARACLLTYVQDRAAVEILDIVDVRMAVKSVDVRAQARQVSLTVCITVIDILCHDLLHGCTPLVAVRTEQGRRCARSVAAAQESNLPGGGSQRQ